MCRRWRSGPNSAISRASCMCIPTWGLRKLHDALARLDESLSIKVKLGDRYGEASSLALLGEAEMKLGKADSAYVRLQASLAARRAIGDREGEAESLRLLGSWMQSRGDPAGARKL